MDIQNAVDRLNALLPLKARQDQLSATLKKLHHKILFSLVERGRPPTKGEMIDVLGNENVTESLLQLSLNDLVVLDAEGKQLSGAYPVTTEATPHKIKVNDHAIYAMCALDAVSVAPVFDTDVVIDSVCHVSQTPISIYMQGQKIIEVQPSTDIMIGIRWQKPSAVAAHSLCMEMVFLNDSKTAEEWQQSDADSISIFTLPAAVDFGKAFFLPLVSGI